MISYRDNRPCPRQRLSVWWRLDSLTYLHLGLVTQLKEKLECTILSTSEKAQPEV